MYQRDYILRIIEEFFKFLGQILKLKSEKLYDQAFDLINQTARDFLKLDLQEVIINEQWISEILNNKEISYDHLYILAELLKAKADIYIETNHKIEAFMYYNSALNLLEHVQNGSMNYSIEIANKIEDIRNLIL